MKTEYNATHNENYKCNKLSTIHLVTRIYYFIQYITNWILDKGPRLILYIMMVSYILTIIIGQLNVFIWNVVSPRPKATNQYAKKSVFRATSVPKFLVTFNLFTIRLRKMRKSRKFWPVCRLSIIYVVGCKNIRPFVVRCKSMHPLVDLQ